uniref:hypothetical protein n=1 Tax=Candidatus Electronema sp. TaxID=2698783 RepID=UPI00405708EE
MNLAGICAGLLRLFGGRVQTAARLEAEAAEPPDPLQVGLDLAATGDPAGCLRLWLAAEYLDIDEEKLRIQFLLLDALRRRLNAGPLEEEEGVSALIKEFSLSGLPGGPELLARCRSIRLARLWRDGLLEDIAVMADQTDWRQPAALAVQAKALCRLLAAEEPIAPSLARLFINAWLTLLFHPEAGPQNERLRQTLLDFSAERLRRQAARMSGGAGLLRQWEELISILESLRNLTKEPICAPALAFQAGLAERHCALIKSGRAAFADETAWLAAGAAYSAAGESLLLLREGREEDALAELPDDEGDSFAAWGAAEVRAACGLRFLCDRRLREAEQVLTGGPAHWTAELEETLLDVLHDELDGAELAASLGILALLPPGSGAADAFCAALAAQAARLRADGASPRLLAAVTAKAAALRPDDEAARKLHEEALLNLELARINEAFACDCFAEAARVAAASRFPQAREHFFAEAGQAAARIACGGCADQEAAAYVLEELQAACSAVDAECCSVGKARL